MLWHRIILLAAIIYLNAKDCCCKKRFKAIYWHTLKTSYNKQYCSDYTANMSADHLSMDMELTFIEDLPADLWLQLRVAYRDSKAKHFLPILAYDINFCSIFSKESNNMYTLHAWLGNFLKYGNMPKSCPVKKGLYYWHKLKLKKYSVPPFIMPCLYSVLSSFYLCNRNSMDELTNTSMIVDIQMRYMR